MPSLRRSSSSPNVRSSPYASSTRSSHPFRRSSGGSETTRRRVLADIDWWTVLDGQTNNQPVYPTSTTNNHDENQFLISPQDPLQDDQTVQPTRPATPINSITLAPPLSEFAALSLAPRTTPLVVRRHTYPTSSSLYPDDPFSSVESSPDLLPIPLTPPPSETPSFVLSFADDYVPDFQGQNYTPPRPSLRSPCRSDSFYMGRSPCDHDDIMFGYRSGSDFMTLLEEDYFY